MRFPVTTALLALLLLTGCTPWLERGRFAVVSSEESAAARYEAVSDEPVQGEGCFTGRQADDLIFSWAVEDALSKPEANGGTALLDATFTNHVEDKSSCLQVSGIPARRIAE